MTSGILTQTCRCESLTVKGTRCRREATFYHRHVDGREYLACHVRMTVRDSGHVKRRQAGR